MTMTFSINILTIVIVAFVFICVLIVENQQTLAANLRGSGLGRWGGTEDTVYTTASSTCDSGSYDGYELPFR
jgi:hypothetical protein